MTDDRYLTGSNWQHVKTGKAYRVILLSTRETDQATLISYQDCYSTNPPIWTRPASEFLDGRFVRLFPGCLFPKEATETAHEIIERGALTDLITAAKPVTETELRAQRDSFVRAGVAFGSDKDEAEYHHAVMSGDQARIAECEAASQRRLAAYHARAVLEVKP